MGKKLTPWYPAHIKPVRDGVYELRYRNKSQMPYPYHYFCDGIWHAAGESPEKVDRVARFDGKFEYLKGAMWRGLLSPSDASGE